LLGISFLLVGDSSSLGVVFLVRPVTSSVLLGCLAKITPPWMAMATSSSGVFAYSPVGYGRSFSSVGHGSLIISRNGYSSSLADVFILRGWVLFVLSDCSSFAGCCSFLGRSPTKATSPGDHIFSPPGATSSLPRQAWQLLFRRVRQPDGCSPFAGCYSFLSRSLTGATFSGNHLFSPLATSHPLPPGTTPSLLG